jgi:serine protease Do
MDRIRIGMIALLVVGGGVSANLRAAEEEPARRGRLGVLYGPARTGTGVVILEVTRDSAAAKAGLKPGDVVVKINDQEIRSPEQVRDMLAQKKAGDKVTLRVLREGKEQEIKGTLDEFPRRTEEREPRRPLFLGLRAEELTADLKKQLKLDADAGVVVMDVAPNSPAEKAGLKRNDVITSIGDKTLKNAADLREAMQKAEAGKEITVHVVRGKEKMTLKATPRNNP